MKRALLTLLTAGMLLAGCGSESSSSAETTTTTSAPAVTETASEASSQPSGETKQSVPGFKVEGTKLLDAKGELLKKALGIEDIRIELRDPDEIRTMWYKEPMALPEVKCYNPAFDVTEHSLVTAIVTDAGIVYPPFDVNLKKIMGE